MSDNSEIAERFSIHHFMRSNGIGPCKFQTGKLCAGSGNIRTCKPSRKKKRFGSSPIFSVCRDAGEKSMGASSPGADDTG